MPTNLTVYSRRRVNRKRYVSKKPQYKLATVKTVKNIISRKMETKFLQGASQYEADAVGQVFQFNGMPTGTDVGQRIGQQIIQKYLDLRMEIFNSEQISNTVRCIIFFYRMDENVVLPSDILSLTGNVNLPYVPISPYNLRNKGAYKILRDKTYVVGSNLSTPAVGGQQPSNGSKPCLVTRMKINLKDHIGEWDGPLASDIMTRGYLGMLLIADTDASNVTDKPTVVWTANYTYKDS